MPNILCTVNTQHTSRQDAMITIGLHCIVIVIIASCLDVCCVLTVHNILYEFDIHNGMASLKKKKQMPPTIKTASEPRSRYASKDHQSTHPSVLNLILKQPTNTEYTAIRMSVFSGLCSGCDREARNN